MSGAPEGPLAKTPFSRVFGSKKRLNKPRNSTTLNGLFTLDGDAKKSNREEERTIEELSERLVRIGLPPDQYPRARLEYVVRSATTGGDIDKCIEMIVLYKDTVDGVIAGFTPSVQFKGAVNREKVTCYLDSLLFAMFAKHDVFEGLLYNKPYDEDDPRRRLVIIIRLWVNMLRTGRLITTDITQQLQDSLAECGWAEAALLRQQDVSEAFAFITDKLDLPLITLKTDLYHSGKEDTNDDHKFITERLLDVAIPEEISGSSVTLEKCLDNYFNNRVEVRRELQRRNTRQTSFAGSDSGDKNGTALHIETAEVDSICESPLPRDSPMIPDIPKQPPTRPLLRERATSIFNERRTEGVDPLKQGSGEGTQRRRTRGNSAAKKEVLMPAWQFLNLIPWYTTGQQTAADSDADHMADVFASTRPMLGICLKRYKMFPNGTSKPLNTMVEIPLEMSSPHFAIGEVGVLEGLAEDKFKLSLQSMVCHRGSTLNSGHYISVVRIPSKNDGRASRDSACSLKRQASDEEADDVWLRMDDLAEPRVSRVNIHDVLRWERPYLLFYRVVPCEDGSESDEPPPYTESGALTDVDQKLAHLEYEDGERESLDVQQPSQQASAMTSIQDDARTSISSNRPDMSIGPSAPATEPTTPGDDHTGPILEDASRTSSKSGETPKKAARASTEGNKFMSKLSARLSRDKLQMPDIHVEEVTDSTDPASVIVSGESREERRRKSKDRSKDRMGKLMGRNGSVRRKRKDKGEASEQTCSLM